jgi:hypothetical protein
MEGRAYRCNHRMHAHRALATTSVVVGVAAPRSKAGTKPIAVVMPLDGNAAGTTYETGLSTTDDECRERTRMRRGWRPDPRRGDQSRRPQRHVERSSQCRRQRRRADPWRARPGERLCRPSEQARRRLSIARQGLEVDCSSARAAAGLTKRVLASASGAMVRAACNPIIRCRFYWRRTQGWRFAWTFRSAVASDRAALRTDGVHVESRLARLQCMPGAPAAAAVTNENPLRIVRAARIRFSLSGGHLGGAIRRSEPSPSSALQPLDHTPSPGTKQRM